MLRTGQRAPTFELPGAGGGRMDTHALAEYADNGWAVVLVSYRQNRPSASGLDPG